MKIKQLTMAVLAVVATTGISAQAQEGGNGNGVSFPDIDRAWLKGGTFIDVEQLRRIGHGMTANQVRELISYPHFNEGFALSNWNYIFNFRTGKGEEYITCQYQVQFKDGKSSAMYWKDNQCEAFLRDKPAPVVPRAVTLSGDGLFAFDRSGLNDLQETGRENLRRLAEQIKTEYTNLRSIDVVGYTDRFGSVEYNNRLSLARANTVKQYFASQGIPAALIRTEGMGPSKPVVFCPGPKNPKVIQCLMPNRRIEVVINGEK